MLLYSGKTRWMVIGDVKRFNVVRSTSEGGGSREFLAIASNLSHFQFGSCITRDSEGLTV